MISHIPVSSCALLLEHDQAEGFHTIRRLLDPASVPQSIVNVIGHTVVGRAENLEHDLVIVLLLIWTALW